MSRKMAAITLLVMALVGFTIAGAVSAADNTVPKPFAPKPSWQWKTFDQGSKYFINNRKNPCDDQKLTYKTYKWRYGWKNSNNQVKIYMQLFNKARASSVKSWRRKPVESWSWVVNQSTIKTLDKQNRFQLKINTLTYNSTGNLTSNTNKTVFTKYDAVGYYWAFKDRRDWKNPSVTPLITR